MSDGTLLTRGRDNVESSFPPVISESQFPGLVALGNLFATSSLILSGFFLSVSVKLSLSISLVTKLMPVGFPFVAGAGAASWSVNVPVCDHSDGLLLRLVPLGAIVEA